MFDLIAGREKHLPSHPTAPILLSTFAQATLIAVIALIPVLFVSERLPDVPTMMAFVAVPQVGPWPRSLSLRRRPRGTAGGAAPDSGWQGSMNRFNPRAFEFASGRATSQAARTHVRQLPLLGARRVAIVAITNPS
jgi:hypothetical protein